MFCNPVACIHSTFLGQASARAPLQPSWRCHAQTSARNGPHTLHSSILSVWAVSWISHWRRSPRAFPHLPTLTAGIHSMHTRPAPLNVSPSVARVMRRKEGQGNCNNGHPWPPHGRDARLAVHRPRRPLSRRRAPSPAAPRRRAPAAGHTAQHRGAARIVRICRGHVGGCQSSLAQARRKRP